MPDLGIAVIGDVTSRCDAEAFGLIVFVLERVFYFWYQSHSLPLEVQAVQDVTHHLNHAPASNHLSESICVTR